ncbi:hypothetical protein [Mesorhizobium argentiipisi]|uniref:Uncharacterized protein n=1 Tax=Mesorhizobium argentiipisi TaxID=3015175 RepID=A0ABU8KCL0_9HYPH
MLARVPWKPRQVDKPKPRARVLSRDRRRHLIDTTAAVLKSGLPTYFAFEGSVRHGLRSSLCLAGWSWSAADVAAADVVDAALRQIGARRPTWQQGQAEYTEDRTERLTCANEGCHKPTAIDLRDGRQTKYCSDLCRRSHADKVHYRSGTQMSKAEWMVFWAAHRAEKVKTRDCERCGGLFVQRSRNGRYCTVECSRAAGADARRTIFEQACLVCGTMFRPPNGRGAKYCNAKCMGAAYRTLPEKTCEHCGKVFRLKESGQRFCSQPCASSSRFRCEAAE